MLYLLLAIIAIGVLLLSEPGKKFLLFLRSSLFVIIIGTLGILIVGFLIYLIKIFFESDIAKSMGQTLLSLFGFFIFFVVLVILAAIGSFIKKKLGLKDRTVKIIGISVFALLVISCFITIIIQITSG